MQRTSLEAVVAGAVLALALVLAALIVFWRAVGVRLSSISPGDGAQASALTAVSVQFSEPMVPASVESRFGIEPDVIGVFHWDDKKVEFRPQSPLEPGTSYTASLAAGSESERGIQVKSGSSWTFEVRSPQLLYLAPASGQPALWRAQISAGNPPPQQLTETEMGILDYSLHSQGDLIAYSSRNRQGGSDLRVLDLENGEEWLLLDCDSDQCSQPDWAPDGDRIAFMRTSAETGASRVWTISTTSAEAAPVFQDPQIQGGDPSWSPDGSKLAFYDISVAGIRILNVDTGQEQVLLTQSGFVGSWSPDSEALVFTVEMDKTVILVDLDDQELKTILVGEGAIGVPAWSPQGDWILLGMEVGLGKQLWLTRPDGSDGHTIVADLAFTHGGYAWDPWGESIVFQRLKLTDLEATPEVMVWSPDGGVQLIAPDAFSPAWLP
jgi:Tol biopolymer transport system component